MKDLRALNGASPSAALIRVDAPSGKSVSSASSAMMVRFEVAAHARLLRQSGKANCGLEAHL